MTRDEEEGSWYAAMTLFAAASALVCGGMWLLMGREDAFTPGLISAGCAAVFFVLSRWRIDVRRRRR